MDMSSELIVLHFKTREEWRAWLARHHASSLGIWFVFYKSHTGQKSIPYEDMVREALCFGWIDSLIKRIDDNRYAIKVTPRQPTSKWSNLNRTRWADLKAVGLLTQAGLAAAPTHKTYAAKPVIPDLPSYIATAFRKNTKAWKFFQKLAPTHRRYFVGWIHTAKRPENARSAFANRSVFCSQLARNSDSNRVAGTYRKAVDRHLQSDSASERGVTV